jgi:hypothetical protein
MLARCVKQTWATDAPAALAPLLAVMLVGVPVTWGEGRPSPMPMPNVPTSRLAAEPPEGVRRRELVTENTSPSLPPRLLHRDSRVAPAPRKLQGGGDTRSTLAQG